MFESVEEFRDLRKKYNGKMFASGVPIFREFEEMEGRALQSGALDRKYKELIGIATSIVSSCCGCIEYHTGAAQAAGATRQEIMETMEQTIAFFLQLFRIYGLLRAGRPKKEQAARSHRDYI
jgi:AhpD family alkylhydroperoxidase